jgi:farnesyl diphosphate synthase
LLPEDPLLQPLERSLRALLEPLPPAPLGTAMEAAVFPGGKRLRPRLMLLAGQVFGASPEALSPAAACLELVHCASLVLDDLPCMDDAPLRRGQPALHLRFSQATAILAAFALLAKALAAFPQALARAGVPPAFCELWSVRLAQLVETLCRGQQGDLRLAGSAVTVEQLEEVHAAKTGAFFELAAQLGALAGGAGREAMACVAAFARNAGLAYQVIDDVRDVVCDPAGSGKPQGQDARAGKPTFAAVLGVAGARQLALELLAAAEASLAPLGAAARPLAEFLDHVRALL